jgi:hypothetical protein
VWNVEIPFTDIQLQHAVMVQNFVNAILDGEALIAPGAEGIHSVELANVMVYSSMLNDTVELPMDSVAWEKKLNQLISESNVQKKVVKVEATDFTASFRK